MAFIEETFEVTCKKCGRRNNVTCYKRIDSFNEREEFFCAYCGLKMGDVGSAEVPKTVLVDKTGFWI